MNRPLLKRLAALAGVMAAMTLTLAACGASGSPSFGARSSTSAAAGAAFNRTKLRACLKAHGVTPPARPSGPAFGFGRGGGAFANPKLRAALEACGGGRFGPGGRFGGGGGLRPGHAAVLRFVACVRTHGYDLPTPNFSGRGSIFSRSIERNPHFQTAAHACASLLRPPGTAGPGPPGSEGAGAGPPSAGAGSPGSTTPAAGT